MSEYYSADGPYKIDEWNLLVRDVNEILQNPPEGSTNCDPIDPLDEVTDPHIWAIADVTEMRSRLKETCPDIDFDEEMDKAWCDCITEPEEIDIELCSFGQTATKAGPNSSWCCGNSIESATCFICVGDNCQETEYQGDWYPSPSANAGKYDAACDTYTEAYNATYEFIGYMNR